MLESAERFAATRMRAGKSPSEQPNAPTGHAFNCCPSTLRGRSVGLTPPCYWLVTPRCYRSVTLSQEVGTKKVFARWLGGIAAPLRKARVAMHQSRTARGDHAVTATAVGWAMRSMPHNVPSFPRGHGSARLCPPYVLRRCDVRSSG